MVELGALVSVVVLLAAIVLVVLGILLPLFVYLIRRDVALLRISAEAATLHLARLASSSAPAPERPPDVRRKLREQRSPSSNFDGEAYGQL